MTIPLERSCRSDIRNFLQRTPYKLILMSLEFVKLCAYNHVALDGFINGADETFQDYTSFFSKLIWIDFYNL